MTAREFAAAIDRPYPTVALWLRQNRVPGAYQEKVGDFSVWQIPIEAVKGFEQPKLGRPPKSTEGEAAQAESPPENAKKRRAKKGDANKTGKK